MQGVPALKGIASPLQQSDMREEAQEYRGRLQGADMKGQLPRRRQRRGAAAWAGVRSLLPYIAAFFCAAPLPHPTGEDRQLVAALQRLQSGAGVSRRSAALVAACKFTAHVSCHQRRSLRPAPAQARGRRLGALLLPVLAFRAPVESPSSAGHLSGALGGAAARPRRCRSPPPLAAAAHCHRPPLSVSQIPAAADTAGVAR